MMLSHRCINEENNLQLIQPTLFHDNHVPITLMFSLLRFPPSEVMRMSIGSFCIPCKELPLVDYLSPGP